MKTANGKIIEATENELFDYYLEYEWDIIMSFRDFLQICSSNGTSVVSEDAHADHQ